MLKIFKFFLLLLAMQLLILLQGCSLIIISLEYFHKSGNGEKDVSANFERGHVVGKEYELLADALLNQMRGDKQVSLDPGRISSYTIDKDGARIELEPYLFSRIIPKGTKFRVCGVLVKTSFGTELCSQYILATLLDEYGNPISINDFSGNPAPVYVTYLFENTFEMPNQNWVFTPKPKVIKEIEEQNEQ
jgi:hypothetical protein